MCTAISIRRGYPVFGRTLDNEKTFGEQIYTLPRDFRIRLIHGDTLVGRFAAVGTAVSVADTPLFFDGGNECGLFVAGLNLPESTRLGAPEKGKNNLASCELISYILTMAGSLSEAKELLDSVHLTDARPSDGIDAATLHYFISDSTGTAVVEATADGLTVTDNPPGVLPNEPIFSHHISNLSAHLHLFDRRTPERRFGLDPISHGTSAVGLPGDFSSPSRFLRAAYLVDSAPESKDARSALSSALSILECLSIPDGALPSGDGFMSTRYISVFDPKEQLYYVKRPTHRSLYAVSLGEAFRMCGGVLNFLLPELDEPITLSPSRAQPLL